MPILLEKSVETGAVHDKRTLTAQQPHVNAQIIPNHGPE
jgi:hypothetical protein